ncbi:MAG: TolC family protein [Elusimicrobia bacterium]|nr:TolC family protein [Elusimicrobiota bacterium]
MKERTTLKLKKGDKTRRRILETASALMAERGPDAVSMREISARLKITKPVLYYYFKDKDELIKAAFVEGTKHLEELHKEIANPGLTLEQKLARLFSNHLDFIKRYPDMPKCALKIMASPSSGVLSSMARELKQRNRAVLRRILEKENLPRQDADDILHMISAVISYFMIEAREHGAASLSKALPGRLAKLICAGTRHTKALAAALLLWTALVSGARASALNLTLDDAVRTALKNNATVVTAEGTRRIYKEKVTEYWGSVYPQLSATGQYTRNIESPAFFFGGAKIKSGLNNVYSASLDLKQVLWAGGKVSTGIKMAHLYSDASDEQLKIAQKSISMAVKQVYYGVLLARAISGIQKESLDLARQHLDMINAQYKQGIASDLAVLRQKVEVSNTEPALTQAQNLYEEGRIDLKNLLGLDPETDITLSDGFNCAAQNPGEISELYKEALSGRPEYRNMKYQLDLYTEMITIERAEHFPYLSAVASRQFQGQSDSGFPSPGLQSWSTTAGLKLSLPLFAGGSVSSRTRQAELQAGIVRTNLAELERDIKIEVKKAWLNMKEAAERLASQTTAVEQARQALTATEVRFKNGLSSQLELNDASLALNKSQTFYIQAQHDTCSADAKLKWTLGE